MIFYRTFMGCLITGMLLSQPIFAQGDGSAQKALKSEPTTLLMRGIAALEEGDLASSENIFKQLIALHPEEPAGYANLGLTYIRLNDPARAEENLAEALKRAPKSTPILWLHAKSAYRENKIDIALDRLRTALDSAPEDYRIRYDLAFLLALKPESATEAIEHFRKIIEARPRNFAARMEYLKAILPQQNAEETLNQIKTIRPMVTVTGQAESILNQLPPALEKGEWNKATPMLRGIQNVLRATDRFRADLKELKGPDDEQVGIPLDRFLAIQAEEPHPAKPINITFKVEPLLSGPIAFATDTNRDGASDIVMAASDAVYLINSSTETQRLATGARDGGIRVADIDNDHVLDLLTWLDNTVVWMKGTATGYESANATNTITISGIASSLLTADFDHDGDLDLFVATQDKGDRLIRNNMDGTWTDVSATAGLIASSSGPAQAVFADFNDDGDTDLVVVGAGSSLRLYDNRRQMRFDDIAASAGLGEIRGCTALDSGDVDNDGDFDLVIGGPKGQRGLMVYPQVSRGIFGSPQIIRPASPELDIRALRLADLNNDGWLDIIVSDSVQGWILPGDPEGLWKEELRISQTWSAEHIEIADVDKDRDPDFLAWDDKSAFLLRNEGGNTNHAICIDAVGMRQESIINNAFALGSDLLVVSGRMKIKRTITEARMLVGLGDQDHVDIVRVLFSNGVPINVFDPPMDVCITVKQVPKGSCPWIFVWNGERFEFTNDILTESGIGLRADENYTEAVDPDQIISVAGDRWIPRDGRLEMRFTEELGESVYLDAVRLMAIDHPSGVDVIPNEGHGFPPFPEFKIHTVTKRIPLQAARDDKGRDILPALIKEDGQYWGEFEKDGPLAVAKRHSLDLDFGQHADASHMTLFAAGWIWWPDTSAMAADAQNSRIELLSPRLEAMDKEGKWTVVEEYMRYPAGQPKAAVIDLTGKVDPSHVKLRITSSLYLYWDTFYLSVDPLDVSLVTTEIPLVEAHLHYRGYSHLVASGTSTPHVIDYDRVDHAQRWRPLSGAYTRYGDIMPLLDTKDDLLATMNTGDEISLAFDAQALPPLQKGFSRTYFFTAVGWDKDADLNTTASATLEPLPWHDMAPELYGFSEAPEPVRRLRETQQKMETRRVDDHAFRTWVRYSGR